MSSSRKTSEASKKIVASLPPGWSIRVDEDRDIVYVSTGHTEPSVSIEVDDCLVLEQGVFSGIATGFMLIEPRSSGFRELEVRAIAKKLVKRNQRNREQLLEKSALSEGAVTQAMKAVEKVLR